MTNTSDSAAAQELEPMTIINRRILAAPCSVVFEAFSQPENLTRWWGPAGFTNTFHEFEFRPGGPWRFTMHGPDGGNYENESEFVEIIQPKKIVLVHLRPMHRYEMTVTLDGKRDPQKTVLTWQMVFDPSKENEKLKHFIFDANEQNFDRLETCLKDLMARKESH